MIRLTTFTPRVRTLVVCSLAGTLMASPIVAAGRSQPSPAQPSADSAVALEIRNAAVASFARGDYPAAIRGFKAAYERSAEPTDLYNLGRIHEEIGDLPKALEYYEKFVMQPHLKLEERRMAAERIEVLRVLVKPEPEPEPIVVADPVDPSEDDPRPTARPMVVTGSVLLGLGVALAAGGGVVFGLQGQRAREEIEGLAEGTNPRRLTLSEAEALDLRGRNADVLQIAFIATGGAAAIVGASLLTAGLLRRSKDRRSTVHVTMSPRHAMVSASWSF